MVSEVKTTAKSKNVGSPILKVSDRGAIALFKNKNEGIIIHVPEESNYELLEQVDNNTFKFFNAFEGELILRED